MNVITAVNEYKLKPGQVSVFLAGGITDCWDWQQEVIKELSKFSNTENLVVFNPRRSDFSIDDPNAAQIQIEWEYKYLHEADIFSMYFTEGKSTQPICMYELGVHLTRLSDLNSLKPLSAIISVESGYCRAKDVLIQSKLAMGGRDIANMNANAKHHAKMIYDDYLWILHGDQND